jgi:hypothetical protein
MKAVPISPQTIRLLMKGQSSLEALLSLAAFLSALLVLILAAQSIMGKAEASVQNSAERHLLSYEALSIDAAAGSLSGAALPKNFSGLASESSHAICSRRSTGLCEPIFHAVSTDSEGNAYVQNSQYEPV